MAVSESVLKMMESSSWIRKMFEKGDELRKRHGKDKVFDFSLGNPFAPPPAKFNEVVFGILRSDIPKKHSYMPNAGYPETRKRVAEYISGEYGVPVDAGSLIMTCGAGGGMNVVLKTLLNPGDNVLVSTPCFMEYRFYAENHGGVLQLVPGRDTFDLDIESFGKSINERTAAVIINSPNNPSGFIYPEETIASLSQLLKRKSRELGKPVYLVSDEPYRKLVYENTKVPSILEHYDNSFVVNSYSKDLSLAGERIGWTVVHPRAEDHDNLVNGMILCNRILGFVNAPALMQRAIAELQEVTIDIDIYKKKRDRLCDALRKIGYEFILPKGTFYLMPKAPGGDDLKFVEILQEENILTVPGRGFGLPGYFRISFCVEDRVIANSIPGFERAFKRAQI